MRLFSAKLLCPSILLIAVVGSVAAVTVKYRRLRDQRSPTGGYRRGLDTEESIADERHAQLDQFPARVRSAGVRYATETSASAEDATLNSLKDPISYRVEDHSPWRPMVSESTPSHARVHKSTFSKGFKFHSFADEKHEPGVADALDSSHLYSESSASAGPHETRSFLVPARRHQRHHRLGHGGQRHREERVHRQRHFSSEEASAEKQGPSHSGEHQGLQLSYQMAEHGQSHRGQVPDYGLEHHHFQNAAHSPAAPTHSEEQQQQQQQQDHSQEQGQQQHVQHGGQRHLVTRNHYQTTRQSFHLQPQQHGGHEHVQYVYIGEPGSGHASKEAAGSAPGQPSQATQSERHGKHARGQVELQQQPQFIYGTPSQYGQPVYEQQQSTGKDEEEPSDDVLLAHIPLPKSKIAVEVDDVEDSRSQHEHHGVVPGSHLQKSAVASHLHGHHGQHQSHSSGPIYRVINGQNNKDVAIDPESQSLEYDFQQHFKQAQVEEPQLEQHHVHQTAYRTTTAGHGSRKAKQFTIRASPVGSRSPQRLYTQSKAYIVPQRHAIQQTLLQTPASLQAAFGKATLHRMPQTQPKAMSYLPLMLSYGGGPRGQTLIGHDSSSSSRFSLHPHRPSAALFSSSLPDRAAYLGGFPFSDQAVSRVPGLTRDIQTYIKKKSS